MDSIGHIIQRQRKRKNMTQEALGEQVFVTKQAVSKWETGRTLPDIETLRKLCQILEISGDEILGSSVNEVRKSRSWLRLGAMLSAIYLAVVAWLGLTVLVQGSGGIRGVSDRYLQYGVTVLSVWDNGELLSTEHYIIETNLPTSDGGDGYQFTTGYGKIFGVVLLEDGREIQFGFNNTNAWHHIHIRLDVDNQDDHWSVQQTVAYRTDKEQVEVMTNEGTASQRETISVFRDGV